MKRIRVLAILFLALLPSCIRSDDDGLPDGVESIVLKPLGDLLYGADLLSCTKGCYAALISKEDTNYVINSNDDYLKFRIRASCLQIQAWPDVDFTKNTVLAGIIIAPTSCPAIVRADLTGNASSGQYTLMVTLQQGASATPSAIFFWGLTSRLPDNASVIFTNKYITQQ